MRKLTFELEFITPAFIGNAQQQAELRPASFVGLLRWWWRVILATYLNNSEEIFKYEAELFGSQEKTAKIMVRTKGHVSTVDILKDRREPIYMLGMGAKGRTCIPSGSKFYLEVIYREVSEQLVRSLVNLAINFSGIGYRARKGFGNMKSKEEPLSLKLLSRDYWSEILSKDKIFKNIPKNGSGFNELPNLNNLRVLRYQRAFDNWEDAIRFLGNLYRNVRLKNDRTYEYKTGIAQYIRSNPIPKSIELKNYVFGLPIMYQSRSLEKRQQNNKPIRPQAQLNWSTQRRQENEERGDRRRGSPFIFLVKEDGFYVLAFMCRFLPEGANFLLQTKGKYWDILGTRRPGRENLPYSEEKFRRDFEDAVSRLKSVGFVEVKV